MRAAGITRARMTGIGLDPTDGDVAVTRSTDDPVADELTLQADGVRRLLDGQDRPEGDFLLVSIGTGTSYTLVPASGAPRRFPIGNAIGGGFVAALAAWQAVGRSEIEGYASRGEPRDIRIKDLVPAKAGTMEGEFVVSHFGKDEVMGARVLPAGASPLDDYCATVVHCAAVTVIRDVLLLAMIPGFAADNVVFVGTPVAKMGSLRGHLALYAQALGKRPHFPVNGEFSAAIGALHAAD